MIFGTSRISSGSVRRWTRRQAMFALGGAAAMALVAGCGGGSGSGGGSGNGGGGGGTKATFTGRVLDVNNGDLPVQGATVTINGATGVSGADGFFTVESDPVTTNIAGTLVGPNNAYYMGGYFNGKGYNNFLTGGFPVAPLDSGETRNLGTFKLGSIAGGPPFPPFFD